MRGPFFIGAQEKVYRKVRNDRNLRRNAQGWFGDSKWVGITRVGNRKKRKVTEGGKTWVGYHLCGVKKEFRSIPGSGPRAAVLWKDGK